MTLDLLDELSALGQPMALFRRVSDTDSKLSAVDDDDDLDDEELERAWERRFLPERTVRDGYRFAAALAAAKADTNAFAWVIWARAVARDVHSGLDDGYSSSEILGRHLREWLRLARKREGVEAVLGRLEKLAAAPSPRGRALAASVLNKETHPAARDIAIRLAADPEPSVRNAVTRPDVDKRFGLLAPDAGVELRGPLESLEPAYVAVFLDGRTTGEQLAAACACLSDELACALLPRLVEGGLRTTTRNVEVLRSLFARRGGAEAFLVGVLPRLGPSGAWSSGWAYHIAASFEGVPHELCAEAMTVFLREMEQRLPPPEVEVGHFHDAVFLAHCLKEMAPLNPDALEPFVARYGDEKQEPPMYKARFHAILSITSALQTLKRGSSA